MQMEVLVDLSGFYSCLHHGVYLEPHLSYHPTREAEDGLKTPKSLLCSMWKEIGVNEISACMS